MPALEWTKTILFKPFNLEKWMAIGFCAWLSTLGESSGGGGANFNYGVGSRTGWADALRNGKDWVVRNQDWLIPLGAALVVAVLILWVVLVWLSSRGRFMFLHCVAGNRAEVRVPWNTYGAHGHSLFLFRMVLGLLGVLGIVPLLVVGFWQFKEIADIRSADLIMMARLGAVVIGVGIMALVFGVVGKLTSDFVVPIMFLRTSRCLGAWNEFWGLFSAHFGSFVLYLLFQLLLHGAIALLVLAVVLVTCCVAGCLLAIPYVGTVLLLPVLVFSRSYSLHFLAQLGTRYDVFAPAD